MPGRRGGEFVGGAWIDGLHPGDAGAARDFSAAVPPGRGTNLAVRSLVQPARRVLAIDDDADFRVGLTDVLEERGYRVRAVSNGREALEELRREPAPDVILLDLRMPEMDGRTFRRELSRDARLARIPLVVISGSREVEGEAESLGAAAVLPKPFGVDALLKSIETVTQH